MLRAHRQAWCWQDEYHGLQLADIRKLEYETQIALQETMAAANESDDFVQNNESSKSTNKKSDIVDNLTSSSDLKHTSSPIIQVTNSNNGLPAENVKSGSPVPSQISKHSIKSRSKSQLSRSKTSLGKDKIFFAYFFCYKYLLTNVEGIFLWEEGCAYLDLDIT